MKIIPLKQRSKEWLDYRSNHICASEASVILGLNPYKTIEQLYDEKTKRFEQTPNYYMLRGIELEPLALEMFEQETGLSMFPMVGEHETIPWMCASFDAVTICRTKICEIKANGKKNHALALKGQIPEYYKAQIQHQICVADVEFSYYYSFDGESGVTIEVKRDQQFIDILLEKEFEFWQSLQANI